MMGDILAAMEWSHVSVILNVATPVIVGIIGFFVKRTLTEIDRRLSEQAQRQDEIEARLLAIEKGAMMREECCQSDVVLKEDWLRESGIIRKQQERVLGEIQQLRGRTDAGVEIASAIAAALNRARES